MKIRHFKKVPQEHWNQFVDQSPSAWLYHLWEWQELMSRTWKGYNLSFAVGEDDRMTGILPAFQMEAAPHLIDSGFGHGGFAYSGKKTKVEVLRFILSMIRNFYWNNFQKSMENMYFRIVLPPFESFEKDFQEYVSMGFQDVSVQSRIIDLDQSEDKIFAEFSSTTRNNIRNALKAGITCKSISLGEESAKTYYDLHSDTYRRNNLTPHPFEYFYSLHTLMKDHYICMAVYDGDEQLLNMANFAFYKACAFYGTAASTDDSKATNAAKVLQWEAMKELRNRGVKHYAIGEVFPDSKPEDGKYYGLTRFKSSFGGKTIFTRKVVIKIMDFLNGC